LLTRRKEYSLKENFFADYKKFIVLPDEKKVGKKEFDPQEYAAYYILTMSLYNSKISTWKEAAKYEIDIDKSIKTVIEDFNQKQDGLYYLQLLELVKFNNYFILALSFKHKLDSQAAKEKITYIIDKLITNSFYVGQNWFTFTGERGRVERKLFCYSFKEYIV
jgi:hypothetical protein